jgi:hypothetical protein
VGSFNVDVFIVQVPPVEFVQPYQTISACLTTI